MLAVTVAILALVLQAVPWAQAQDTRKFSADDCTWQYFEQPLSHFARGSAGTYKQRLCVYNKFWTPNEAQPVLFYTGNESPVNEYVDNTGLMWELGAELNALIVFAEHRYFGESVPDIGGVENCLAPLSSEEALADYAYLINHMRREWGAADSAVIAFGGSYGGMLSSWLRIMYPSAVDGAIAASAPVLGLPLDDVALDSSARAVTYATSAAAGNAPLCEENLKKAWVLLTDLSSTADGREAVSDAMGLCDPLSGSRDVATLVEYLQSPLFDLAEGSYPFASDYITFALTGTDAPLPPWAMHQLCEPLGRDFGITLQQAAGSKSTDVRFTVSSSASQQQEVPVLSVAVDWDTTSNNGYSVSDVRDRTQALDLLGALGEGIQVWYNVTGLAPSCVDWKGTDPAPNAHVQVKSVPLSRSARRSSSSKSPRKQAGSVQVDGTSSNVCTASKADITVAVAWGSLVCNEGINLINTAVHGVGNDNYWPPNVPQDYTRKSIVEDQFNYCQAFRAQGLYGLPKQKDVDDWGYWMDTAYGGSRLEYASNIFYSNGNLDPWGPAGVPDTDTEADADARPATVGGVDRVISRTIDMGGHHLDLFWPTEHDPQSVLDVREEERAAIRRWIAIKAASVSARKTAVLKRAEAQA